MIIDFHTHAFPDKIAAGAIKVLEGNGKIKANTDGTVMDLQKKTGCRQYCSRYRLP